MMYDVCVIVSHRRDLALAVLWHLDFGPLGCMFVYGGRAGIKAQLSPSEAGA